MELPQLRFSIRTLPDEIWRKVLTEYNFMDIDSIESIKTIRRIPSKRCIFLDIYKDIIQEYVDFMCSMLYAIKNWDNIIKPHLLTPQYLIDIVYHLKLYSVSIEDISIDSNGYNIDIIADNMNINININYLNYSMDGVFHCSFGPASIRWNNEGVKIEEEHYENGMIHSTYGPAFKSWYRNGNKQCEEYIIKGKSHRTDGPAILVYDINGILKSEEYYIFDKKYEKQEFLNLTIDDDDE